MNKAIVDMWFSYNDKSKCLQIAAFFTLKIGTFLVNAKMVKNGYFTNMVGHIVLFISRVTGGNNFRRVPGGGRVS